MKMGAIVNTRLGYIKTRDILFIFCVENIVFGYR